MSMTSNKASASQPPRRLTGIQHAANEFDTTGYTILKWAIAGALDVEMVDDEPKVTLESIERLKRQRAADAQEVAA
jgi:hypothetical protein